LCLIQPGWYRRKGRCRTKVPVGRWTAWSLTKRLINPIICCFTVTGMSD
jgi:hypothetical protein